MMLFVVSCPEYFALLFLNIRLNTNIEQISNKSKRILPRNVSLEVKWINQLNMNNKYNKKPRLLIKILLIFKYRWCSVIHYSLIIAYFTNLKPIFSGYILRYIINNADIDIYIMIEYTLYILTQCILCTWTILISHHDSEDDLIKRFLYYLHLLNSWHVRQGVFN